MISVEHLSVKYGSFEVLHDISFRIKEGDFLGIVGPNGSGKSTLIKTLVGLISPAGGKVSIQNNGSGTSSIGYLPQSAVNGFINFPATVSEVVASGLLPVKKFPKWLTNEDRLQIDKALKLLQIENLKHKQIGKLSGGQQQRVHLARALVSDSKLLVLDEPTGALDPSSRDCFYETLKNLNQHSGISIILVSHDSHTIGQYVNKILYMDRRILFFGTYDEFEASPSKAHYFGNGSSHECEMKPVEV